MIRLTCIRLNMSSYVDYSTCKRNYFAAFLINDFAKETRSKRKIAGFIFLFQRIDVCLKFQKFCLMIIQLLVCKNVYIDEKEDRKRSSTKARKKDTENRIIQEILREVLDPLIKYPIKRFTKLLTNNILN